MRYLKTYLALLTLAMASNAAWAERSVEKSISASADAIVEIENIAGSVRVIGWDQASVRVTGTLGDDVEDLSISKSDNEIYIEVEIDSRSGRSMMNGEADLEIQVPQGASVGVSTVSANIEVREISGSAELESVSGNIQVTGELSSIEAETVSGKIDISGGGTQAEVESVNGTVTVTGVTGSVEVATVSGAISVTGDAIREADFESVAGDIEFHGSLAVDAELNVEAHSSTVTLFLPPGLSAYVEVQTFSGRIENDFGPAAERVEQYALEQRLEFRAGDGQAEIAVETFSGDVFLRKLQ